MRFGTWNVMSLYTSGSLTTVARELAKYKLDLVGVQEVRWDRRRHCKSRGYIFFWGEKKLFDGNRIFGTPQNRVE